MEDKKEEVEQVQSEAKSDASPKVEDPKTKICDFCCAEIAFKATRCRYCSSHLTTTKSETEEKDTFSIIKEEINFGGLPFSAYINNVGHVRTKLYVRIKDQELKSTLCSILGDYSLYEQDPKISGDRVQLFRICPKLPSFFNPYKLFEITV